MPIKMGLYCSIACLFCMLYSCNKESDAESSAILPVNLIINSRVSADGSGLVAFTATAQHAVNYFFEFGNGAKAASATGSTTYVYPEEGSIDYTVVVTAVGNTGQSIQKSATITVTKQLTIFWSDEFEVDGPPNSIHWGYDLGAGGWGNNELQFYTDRSENAIVAGGLLKIRAIKETYQGAQYTSARMLTKDKFAFTYGKLEVRARLPAGAGTWPAIWMLGSNIGTVPWPACGEIDIMEHKGNEPNRIYGTLHYPERYGGNNPDGGSLLISNASNEFHIYSLKWYPGTIKLFVDDQLFHTVNNSASIPFNHDFYIIMNIAMGGGFGGVIDPAFNQATMEVDYIRVYK